jgi:hypothetical protein
VEGKTETSNVATEFAFLSDGPSKSAESWIFDSGASTHISNHERDFVNRHLTEKQIRGAFGNSHRASFSGTAVLKLSHGGDDRVVSLDGTLCSKQMQVKLLSIPALDRKSLRTVFADGRVAVFRQDGVLVMTGTLVDKQYRLDQIVDASVKTNITRLFQ